MIAGKTDRFYLTNVKSSSTSNMTNFFINVKIPTDCLRIGTFYSGTYNIAAVYSLYYKTNLNDYRLLAANLSAKSSYSYNLDSNSLSLPSSEYVTDIKLVFPQVYAGFKSSTTPSFDAIALYTVPNMYQYQVLAEIGVMNGASYYTNSASCSGFVQNAYYYNYNVENPYYQNPYNVNPYLVNPYYYYMPYMPKKLPKTGY